MDQRAMKIYETWGDEQLTYNHMNPFPMTLIVTILDIL